MHERMSITVNRTREETDEKSEEIDMFWLKGDIQK
jgi:hypothetical protein